MKYKQYFTLFFIDHLWIILLFTAAPVGFILLSLLLSGATPKDTLYYVFLSFIILICFRLYSTWNLYEMFCSDEKNIGDYIISQPRSNNEKQYKALVSKIRKIYKNEITVFEEKKNQIIL